MPVPTWLPTPAQHEKLMDFNFSRGGQSSTRAAQGHHGSCPSIIVGRAGLQHQSPESFCSNMLVSTASAHVVEGGARNAT